MTIASQLSLLLAATAALAPVPCSAAVAESAVVRDVTIFSQRATDQSTEGYAPSDVDCPKENITIRDGSRLSPEERSWIPKRRNETVTPIRDLLSRLAIPDFDSKKYLSGVENDTKALPNIGIAISGGGYRAMLNGAGAVAAWDSRSTGSEDKGNFGGLLQSATYISGLSGGNWLVGSMYANNFSSVQAAVNDPDVWQFDQSILKGPEKYSLLQYYQEILNDVEAKVKAGFDSSITDYWGRMLSYQLINATNGGPGFTFSSIADDPDFASGKLALPLLVADGRSPGQKIVPINSTVYEFSPWEFGSYDPSLRGFVPLKWVGSNFSDGAIKKNGSCINGFDNAGFVMGTSSSLFNQIVLYLRDGNSQYVPDGVPQFIVDALKSLLTTLGNKDDDIADWTPNPFFGYNKENNPGANSTRLTLVDGGEDLQNVPYHPHLFQEREVDVIFSIDSSADTESGWPDGASAAATYERSRLASVANGTGFPAVPGKDTFINKQLNTHPVFFGCNASNMSTPAPLVVYIPNYPYIYASNISTFKMTILADERDAIIQNGWAVATQLNSTRDENWPACVACAILSRSFDRTKTTVPDKCNQCFAKYCWDGKLNETKSEPYLPDFYSTPIKVKSSDSASPHNFHTSALATIVTLALTVAAFNL